MLCEWIAGALAIALILYCLFGGADFGGGILELFCGPRERAAQRLLITHAMGPVWEANHVWLILAIVILMSGFPSAYAELSTRFHVPLTIMLVGVVLRGCAFTFRHYDAVRDASQRYYTGIFAASSLLTPCMLGMITGALVRNDPLPANAAFVATYITPWCNLFCLSVGLFTCAMFAFLAATYLVGEAQNPALQDIFLRRARAFNVTVVLAGGGVFATAQLGDIPLIAHFSGHWVSLVCMALATAALVPLWVSLSRRYIAASRLLAGAQVALIVVGEFKLQFPRLVGSKTVYNSAAPDATLIQVLWALGVGAVLILPALAYLLHIFKSRRTQIS